MMRRFTSVGVTLAVGAWSWAMFAQDQLKPLDANKARTAYSFPIHGGEMPFRFQVQVNTRGETTGVWVFRGKEPRPFQTIASCDQNHSFSLTEYDEKRELLQH